MARTDVPRTPSRTSPMPPPTASDLSPNGIHLLQTALQVHAQLSAMADNKANILIGGTSLIFTLALGQVGPSQASWPLLILGAMSFCSAVLAVLSILPAISYHNVGSGNLLFFGSFVKLDEEEHATRVLDRLRTDDQIYRLMLHDLYQNGVVLERKKYKLLGYAYRVFLVGLTASCLLFAVQYTARFAS